MKRLILICAFVLSCSHQLKSETQNMNQQTPVEVIQPGMVKVVKIKFRKEYENKNLECKNLDFSTWSDSEYIYGVIAESYFSDLKPFDCYIEISDKKKEKVLSFKVEKYDYKEEHLKVDQKKVELNKKDLMRVAKEQEILNAIYEKSSPVKLFSTPFEAPINSVLTSIYGTKRIFNNKKKTQHLGNDFRAKVGEPIKVSNDGKVVLTDDLFFTGRVVIVDHGLNIFSVYAHLEEIHVKADTMIKKGQVLGLSGATGRVSGPHLHWGVKINSQWIDGFSLINETNKIFANDAQ
jgi:murein DD-endopeptidase MepM/ murein hydrolase activator NlpD